MLVLEKGETIQQTSWETLTIESFASEIKKMLFIRCLCPLLSIVPPPNKMALFPGKESKVKPAQGGKKSPTFFNGIFHFPIMSEMYRL